MFQETYIHRVTTPTLLVYLYKTAVTARCDETSIWWDKCQLLSKKRGFAYRNNSLITVLQLIFG